MYGENLKLKLFGMLAYIPLLYNDSLRMARRCRNV